MPFFPAAGFNPVAVQMVRNSDVRFSFFAEPEDWVNDLHFLWSVSVGFFPFATLPSTTHTETGSSEFLDQSTFFPLRYRPEDLAYEFARGVIVTEGQINAAISTNDLDADFTKLTQDDFGDHQVTGEAGGVAALAYRIDGVWRAPNYAPDRSTAEGKDHLLPVDVGWRACDWVAGQLHDTLGTAHSLKMKMAANKPRQRMSGKNTHTKFEQGGMPLIVALGR
jgi:hypothetical protein